MTITTLKSLNLYSYGRLGICDALQLILRGFFLSLTDFQELQIRNIVEHHIQPAAVVKIIILFSLRKNYLNCLRNRKMVEIERHTNKKRIFNEAHHINLNKSMFRHT